MRSRHEIDQRVNRGVAFFPEACQDLTFMWQPRRTRLTPLRLRQWLTTWLLALSAACAAPPTAQSDAVDQVRGLWKMQSDAWNRGDLEGFMAAYWKSPDLVFFSNGNETRGWQQTLDRYRARYQGQGQEMGELDFPQLEFTQLGGDVVLARGRWHLKMTDGKESGGMTSVIFRKLPEGWRIVHDHSSAESN